MSKYRPITGHWQREFARKNPPKVEPDYKTGADRGKSRTIVVPAGVPITVYSDSDSPAAIQVVPPPDGDRLLITNYPGNEDAPSDISAWLDYARDIGRTPLRVMVTPEHRAKLVTTLQREPRTYIPWCTDKDLRIDGLQIVANDQIEHGEYVIVLEPQQCYVSPPKPQGLEHAWKHPPGEGRELLKAALRHTADNDDGCGCIMLTTEEKIVAAIRGPRKPSHWHFCEQ